MGAIPGAGAPGYTPMPLRGMLQVEDEVANPYHGRMMLECGDVVDE